ncbi:MAG: NTP transferase domain-containing protein [Gammaproteobacteria bacterium]
MNTGIPVDAPALFGLVLAGDRSRRFGSDKAAIDIDGRSLLERTVALLRPLAKRVFVSVRADQTDDPLRGAFDLIVDDRPGQGPAGGLLAAYRRDNAAAWLIVACDMPGLTEAALRALVRRRNPGRAATAYRGRPDGDAEPLCAIYEPATLARFAGRAAAGRSLSPRRLLNDSDVELVEPSDAAELANINTADDLRRGDGG